VFVGRSAETAEAHSVEDVRVDDRRVLVKLEAVDDRTAAELLRGMMVFVRQADAAPPPEGGYYIHDLIGCEVRTVAGDVVGTLSAVLDAPAQHLWVVRSGDAVHNIPAVKKFIIRVDVTGREIIVDLPEGLIGGQG